MMTVNGQPRFYVTGAKGLTIYDVTDPALPRLIGHLPLPHFQNEDVDVSEDGSRVIISSDTVGASPGGRRHRGAHHRHQRPGEPEARGLHRQQQPHDDVCGRQVRVALRLRRQVFDARDPAKVVDTGQSARRTGSPTPRAPSTCTPSTTPAASTS